VFELNGSDIHGSLLSDAYGGKNEPKKNTPDDITVTVSATLYDFYNSSMKKVNYKRKQINPDGRTITEVEEEFSLEIKPGFDESTVLKFPG
jgi:hypothetical protein